MKEERLIEVKNLYYRNVYRYFFEKFRSKWLAELLAFFEQTVFHGVYLNYIEIPITTGCTLNCRECSNLMQYYEKPYQVSIEVLVKSVLKLLDNSDGVRLVRILGGEPLCYAELTQLLEFLSTEKRIQKIQIVTNGTLLFKDEQLRIMKCDNRFSVDISNYEENSIKYNELIEQLREAELPYFSQRGRIRWTKQSDIAYRMRNEIDLKKVYSECSMDCISLLNGEIHVCPRSSHGKDIGLFQCRENDFVNLLDKQQNLHKKLYRLLNTDYVEACNFCDQFRWQELPETLAGEQASRNETISIFRSVKENNDKKVNSKNYR